MSITVHPSYAARAGGWTAFNVREYERKLWAEATELVTEADVLLATGCPRPWDVYGPDDLGARCMDVRVRQDPENYLIWRIVAKYSTDFGVIPNEPEDPMERSTKWRYESVRSMLPLHEDRRGNPFQYTTGRPFKNPPEVIYSTARYTITRNELTFSGATADEWACSVNSGSWYSKAPGTVLLEGISATEEWEGEYHFFIVTYVLHVDRNKWSPRKVPNRDSIYIDENGDEQIVKTEDGIAHDGLTWLDDLGNKSDVANYLEFYLYDEKNFSALSL